ncbi:phospholipase/Carboxylesterase superfamily protein [Phyllosticta paracitricarpa]|uniref:Alpha/Beta hydrolase protein n=2 Tax=Phyllosticta TaxID=121621 RepID=A0ABR1MP98_9PEZI
MAPRLPTADDFPAAVASCLEIVPPPANQPATNVLLLLHGLGDSHRPFANFARQLNLPETACIAVRGPKPLPFDLPGFHWGDDITVDSSTGALDPDAPAFSATLRLVLDDVLRGVLLAPEKCGYRPRSVVLFGYAQGAMAALHVAVEFANSCSSSSSSADAELGGVVAVGGGLPSCSPLLPVDAKARTPVLVCKAARNSAVSPAQLQRVRDAFDPVEVREWNRPGGDGMPRNRDEMLPIMQFFARRLRSVRGVPAGAVELS